MRSVYGLSYCGCRAAGRSATPFLESKSYSELCCGRLGRRGEVDGGLQHGGGLVRFRHTRNITIDGATSRAG
jgi:hypothetical protein